MNSNLNSKCLDKINKNLIIGFLCKSCYSFIFLLQKVCQNCKSTNLRIVCITNEATILSFTVLRIQSLGVKKHLIIAKVITIDGYCLIGNIVSKVAYLSKKKINLINKKVLVSFNKVNSNCYIKI